MQKYTFIFNTGKFLGINDYLCRVFWQKHQLGKVFADEICDIRSVRYVYKRYLA